MKKNCLFFCFLCCVLFTGCTWYPYAQRNFFISVVEPWNDHKQKLQFRKMAKEAWREVESQSPEVLSKAYRKGFEEGFVDYLFYGGNGEPPAVPPWIYRSTHYDTPQGPQAIQDWFAGFRHGSKVAIQSGVRNYIVDPIALPPYVERSSQLVGSPNAGSQRSASPPPAVLGPEPVEMLPLPQPDFPEAPLPRAPLPQSPYSQSNVPPIPGPFVAPRVK